MQKSVYSRAIARTSSAEATDHLVIAALFSGNLLAVMDVGLDGSGIAYCRELWRQFCPAGRGT